MSYIFANNSKLLVCLEQFSSYDTLMGHLSEHQLHREDQAATANRQSTKMKFDKINSRIGKYQCIYCRGEEKFGTDNKSKNICTCIKTAKLRLSF
jgi:hypothetical protein